MKDLKIILGAFLLVLLFNWGLSHLLNRQFKWWITLGMYVGFSLVYFANSSKKNK
ncbi:hypothetical protein IGL76_002084 [Enterococcus sp. DIV2381]|uniref:Uncharacterized protein n=1 Tax=Candidatus Enterococcus mangumiae TaxID=2230878 RepID=A0ABZ2SSU5_9ENTE